METEHAPDGEPDWDCLLTESINGLRERSAQGHM